MPLFAVIILAAPFLLCGLIHHMRLGCKYLFGKSWELWYVRRAVDVSIVSYACLWFVSIDGSGVFEILDQMKGWYPGSSVCYLEGKPQGTALQNLTALDFFIGHFFQFVIAPTALVGFAGYSIERHKAARKGVSNVG